MKLSTTRHGRTRMQQRGFRERDIEVIVKCGTAIRNGYHLLRNRDVDREIENCKRRIQTLERLRGSVAVVEGGSLITCYYLSGTAGQRAARQADGRRRRSRTKP